MISLSGKTAFVSGSAKNTGKQIAKQLLALGARVILHGDQKDTLEATAKELETELYICANLNDEENISLITAYIEQAGGIDILINNQGSARPGPWEKADDEQWLKMYNDNVMSVVRLTRALLPQLKQRPWGRIIQLSTAGALNPGQNMPAYYAAKTALASITVSLMKEMANTGTTVNTISPGLIKTPELEMLYQYKAQKRGLSTEWDDIEKHIIEKDFPNACGRIARCEDIANTVCFLSSPAADYINGQHIRLDGGWMAHIS